MNLADKIYDAVCEYERRVSGLDKFEPESDYQVFWTGEEWRDRGEQYGCTSKLVVVHDGGTYAPYFNYAYGDSSRYEYMQKVLKRLGYWAEPATSWYTAIYRNEPIKKEVQLDTFSVVHAHDILEDLHPRHVEIFWAKLDKRVSYGDASYTLVPASVAISLLTQAGNEYADESGEPYGWTTPDALYVDHTFFAING